ncbi:hypothetical protein DPMN_133575 [Dreissena polymorpha]|uniref:Uncharacterized protein n=1 Tax=Dreissena polymorpha TaxID=45954 RepID=A0A9D4G0E7_DREPO|nr:hypothetical protein DPMN_133575 [Dreissena polymorpha]
MCSDTYFLQVSVSQEVMIEDSVTWMAVAVGAGDLDTGMHVVKSSGATEAAEEGVEEVLWISAVAEEEATDCLMRGGRAGRYAGY